MKKLVVSISVVVAFALGIFSSIHDSNAQMQSRYTIECGLPLDMPPDLWMKYTAQQYNYDTDQMPPDIKEQFECASYVQAQEGFEELTSGLGGSMRN